MLSTGSWPRTAEPDPWEGLEAAPAPGAPPAAEAPGYVTDTLFGEAAAPRSHAPRREPLDLDPLPELTRQLAAVEGATDPGRLRLLLAAESVGALIAAELHHDGLPWRADLHDQLLYETLGPRPAPGYRPVRLEQLAQEVRAHLGAPTVNPDSHTDLLRALRTAGIGVRSTSKWELAEVDHPVVAPLLEYKRLARLLSANGWAWAEAWVSDGRFRPDYVPAGVVTGRWSSSGGGALQLPLSVRAAVRADPGWRLVVADAAQVEPRVLAAMAADSAMAAAARHADLYAGVVEAGIVATRQEAKYAMLGAIYGATTGPSAVLMPHLAKAYPKAVALVEEAARAGERGERVRTWLGRTSPRADPGMQDDAEGAQRRSWGRFTRNFVVQGTAAEWALAWMAGLRRRLETVPGGAHLVFFLHDEVVVHTPADVADQVAQAVRDAAAEAGRLLFGGLPVEFPLDVAVVEGYDEAT